MNGNGGMYNPLFQDGVWGERAPRQRRVHAHPQGGAPRHRHPAPARPHAAGHRPRTPAAVNDTMQITEYAEGSSPSRSSSSAASTGAPTAPSPSWSRSRPPPCSPNWTDACSQGKGWSGVPLLRRMDRHHLTATRPMSRTELDNQFLAKLEKTVADKRQKAGRRP